MNRLLMAGILIAGCTLAHHQVNAQSTRTVGQLYGQGVHAYFDGELESALGSFNQAIEAGTQDPRIFYFRGMVHGEMGDMQAADKDFAAGAKLEAGPQGRYYAIGQSLERVQGELRIRLEDARAKARKSQKKQAANSVAGVMAEVPVIPDAAPAAGAAKKSMNFPDVTGIRNPGTPFPEPLEVNTKKPVTRMAAPESSAAAPTTGQQDPFGDRAPAKTEEKADDDPFAGSDDDPFASGDDKKMEEEKQEEEDDDPFGGGN